MPNKELRDYQISDLAFYMKNPRCLNLSDPATGKTGSVCAYIEYLYKYKNIQTIWSMPKTLMTKNYYELLDFTDLRADQVIVIDGTPKQRLKQIQTPAACYIMGFRRMADDWDLIRTNQPNIDAVIIDELHKAFKSYNSKRTVSLFAAMRRIKLFVGMTGSLIDGRLDAAYPAIHIIEPRYYYDYFAFLNQHGILDDYGRAVEWTNTEKVSKILAKHSTRRTFDQVYGNQDPVIVPHLVDMHTKQREAYDEFEEMAVLELEQYILDGTNPGVAAMRCSQIMACPHTFGLMDEHELTGKEEAIKDLLEDHVLKKTPVIVFAVLRDEQKRLVAIAESLGMRVGQINGRVSQTKRGEVDKAFQNGELDVVIASQETADVGLNWGHVDHVIYSSIDYKDSNFSQSYKRAIRGKRNKTLLITLLEYTDSIDQRKFSVVNRKSSLANRVDSTYKKLDLGYKAKTS